MVRGRVVHERVRGIGLRALGGLRERGPRRGFGAERGRRRDLRWHGCGRELLHAVRRTDVGDDVRRFRWNHLVDDEHAMPDQSIV